ncbi:hypothetical protein V6N13_057125 [Hibiscus sabdariffa]|uniref:Uncharacterized protein n=2 Tax=Hibiscus sabdariffa TaxID=183260 RepID=A0ABR1ZQ02_9ROSI
MERKEYWIEMPMVSMPAEVSYSFPGSSDLDKAKRASCWEQGRDTIANSKNHKMIDGGTSFGVKIEWKTRITNQGGRARGLRSWFAKSTASGFNSHFLQQNGRLFPSLKSECGTKPSE